jgi:hypothetical protein
MPKDRDEDLPSTLQRSPAEVYERAKRLGVRGRSRMTKDQLAKAISRKQ